MDDARPGENRRTVVENSDSDILAAIIGRGLIQTEPDPQNAEATRADVCRLMQMVRNRLTGSMW